MQPFILIMTLLLVFSFFTTSELKRYLNSAYLEKSFVSINEKKHALEKLKKMAELQELKTASQDKSEYIVEKKKEKKPTEKKPQKKRSYKLNFDTARPPNNSRLNLYHFLFQDDSKHQTLFENLLLTLYSKAPFCSDIPNFEKMISQKLLLEKERFKEAKFETKFPDEISSVQFDDDKLQTAFYWMLKGKDAYPSLLNYLTFDTKTNRNSAKINLLFAPKELIMIIFNNPKTSDKILHFRDELFSQILTPETPLTRELIQEKMKEQFVSVLMDDNLPIDEYKKLFDFTLGKPGNVAFIEDPLTKKLIREKLLIQKR